MTYQRFATRLYGNQCPVAVLVALAPFQTNQQPVSGVRRDVVEQERRAVAVRDEGVHLPVVVIVTGRQTAPDDRPCGVSEQRTDIREAATFLIVIQNGRLPELRAQTAGVQHL